ncbi:MAG: hypothetical protein GC162_02975 [Planctomycetes bacterium]|nr:hypothetical protein [Planctomycetota bacterium]
MFIKAVEGAEKVGRQFAERAQIQHHFDPPPRPRPAYNPTLYHSPDMTYGPPWPPTFGPDMPAAIRKKLRERAHLPGTVSRDGAD